MDTWLGCGGRVLVFRDRPSRFRNPETVYRLFRLNAEPGTPHHNREIGRWMTKVDGKEHNTNFVKGKMLKVKKAHPAEVERVLGEDTKDFFGWAWTGSKQKGG